MKNKIDSKFAIELPNPEYNGYNIHALRDVYRVDELLEGLWVVIFEDGGWCDFTFLEWSCSSEGQDYATPFLTVSGPGGLGPEFSLRECRHSYWGNYLDGDQTHGYLFYMNFKHVKAAMDFLGDYFDGN